MKRVLVTGASGFIGHHCIPLLLDREYEVHAVSSRAHKPECDGVEWHPADLLDKGNVYHVVENVRPTHLLHLAWRRVQPDIWTTMENQDWVSTSLNLFRAFHSSGGCRLVSIGSCGEYDWRYGLCTEDLTPTNPSTLYGACKNAVRQTLEGMGTQTGLSWAWARVFFVYGPGEHAERLVASVISHLLRDEEAPCSHGRQVRDYMHVQDVANGIITLLDSDKTGAFNITSGECVMLKDLVLAIGTELNRTHLIKFGETAAPPHEPPLIVGNPEKAAKALGWRRQIDLADGIRDTIAWWARAIDRDI